MRPFWIIALTVIGTFIVTSGIAAGMIALIQQAATGPNQQSSAPIVPPTNPVAIGYPPSYE